MEINGIEKEINIRIKHEAVLTNNYRQKEKIVRSDSIVIDGVDRKCSCGKDPVVVLIVYGRDTVYCAQCISSLFNVKIPCPK